MCRCMLSAIVAALVSTVAFADDPRAAKQAPTQIIKLVVTQEAQPMPAGPSATATNAPVIIVAGPEASVSTAGCGSEKAKSKVSSKKIAKKANRREDCEGCGSCRYEAWFVFSSCRSFFNEGPFSPRYPDKCPSCRPKQ